LYKFQITNPQVPNDFMHWGRYYEIIVLIMEAIVPNVLGSGSFTDVKEASLCAIAEGTVGLPRCCLFFGEEQGPGMTSYWCDLRGGEEFVGRCPRVVGSIRAGVVVA
jgi:hypothetical protein